VNPEEALRRFLFLIFMTTNKLPTFRTWGKKLLEWKRAIVIALLILSIHRIAAHYLKQYYAAVLTCDQPCQDALSCDPLEFTFEIKPTNSKLGTPSYLWYHAALKNRSCRRLRSVYVKEFLDSSELRKSVMGLWVTVTGPNGREIERLPAPGPDGGIAWDYGSSRGVQTSTKGTIHPYHPDFARILQLLDSPMFGGSYFISLMPGETFGTIPPVLQPYRLVATSSRSEDGGIGDGTARAPVENPPKFQVPPNGFNLLDRYALKHPGRYTINAGFLGELAVYPDFPRWHTRAPWIDWIFPGITPVTWVSEKHQVNLISPPVYIEVTP
jgi:hypothetical protein